VSGFSEPGYSWFSIFYEFAFHAKCVGGRIVVVHIFIIAGAFIVMGLNSPMFAMVLFVVIKTGVDLHMHRQERKLLSEAQ